MFFQMHPPTFRITREKENRLTLHYLPGKPTRKGLSPLLVGMQPPIETIASIGTT